MLTSGPLGGKASVYVNLDHAANAGIIAHRKARYGQLLPDVDVSRSPDSFERPYDSLGTRPDIVGRLWQEITVELPEQCEWVVYRSPVLVHLRTGIIFGWAGGTHTYA